MSARENFKVIGLGGIGSVVAEGLAMYLASEWERAGLWLASTETGMKKKTAPGCATKTTATKRCRKPRN